MAVNTTQTILNEEKITACSRTRAGWFWMFTTPNAMHASAKPPHRMYNPSLTEKVITYEADAQLLQ